jgi:hypothetical protein
MKRKLIYALVAVLIILYSGLIVWSTFEPEESFTGYREELYARWMLYLVMSSIPVDPCPLDSPSFVQIMLTPSGRNKPVKADSDKIDTADGEIDQSAE